MHIALKTDFPLFSLLLFAACAVCTCCPHTQGLTFTDLRKREIFAVLIVSNLL